MASFLGSVGLLFFVVVGGYLLLYADPKKRLALLPWGVIQLYVMGNAFLTAIMRSHLGVEQAMMSRYACIPALFWTSFIVISVYYLCGDYVDVTWRWSWRRFVTVFAVIALFILAMYPVGFNRTKETARAKSLQPLALLSVRVGVPDDAVIYHAITIVPGQFVNMVPILKKYGHIPFDKVDTTCGQFNQPLPAHTIDQPIPDKVNGYFDFMDRFSKNGYRVVG